MLIAKRMQSDVRAAGGLRHAASSCKVEEMFLVQ